MVVGKGSLNCEPFALFKNHLTNYIRIINMYLRWCIIIKASSSTKGSFLTGGKNEK
jgi:hypothetical protein